MAKNKIRGKQKYTQTSSDKNEGAKGA